MRRMVLCAVAGVLAGAARGAAGEAPLVAVVFGEHSYQSSPQGEGRGARTFMDTVENALQAAGVAYAKLTDSDVEAGRLKAFPIALFPYNFALPEAEQAAIERYVTEGGKIAVFYTVHERIAKLLGLRYLGHRMGEPRNQFATIRLRQDLIAGLPPSVRQDSWNISRVAPGGADVQVVGEWMDPEGKALGEPAVLLSPRGVFVGHILTEGDAANKGRMLLALIGHLVPEAWARASAQAMADAPKMGPVGSLDELGGRVEKARVSSRQRRRARRLVAEARAKLAEAETLARDGKHGEAIAAAHTARERATEALALSAAERLEEFRGVWIHTAYGVRDWGWERSIRHLRDNGFNAVIPNLLWAGLAHYPSELLPVAADVAKKGDQIAECLRWCRRYGVEMHVWKVNYNLGNAPKEFVEALRAEGRLQRHRDGSELLWLCPSDPRNFALERDGMLEVVRKYGVAGIHFDYIRYPHDEACFCAGCRGRFEEAAGEKVEKWPDDVLRGPLKEPFTKWRQDQITKLVRAVSTEAKVLRPGILVSAAVFSDWAGCRYYVGQDWKLWVEEGLLDFACPMDYTKDASRLETMVASQAEWVGGRVPLYAGIGAWEIRDVAGLIDQIERARRLGADGFQCFHYDDLEFAEKRLPALHRSLTASRTRPPHPAPHVEFRFPPGLGGAAGPAYAEGTEIAVAVTLKAEGNYAREPRSASGRLCLETTEGQEVRRFGRVNSGDRGPLSVALRAEPGRYRLAVRGSVSFGWLRSESFVVRGRPFEVVSREAAAAERAKGEPPRFEGRGLKVGVATGGYGSEAILAALKKAEGIEAVALHQLGPEFLKPCQVVVFPQRRSQEPPKAELARALGEFVAAGGGLLATHDAPGFRIHPVLIPDVCRGGTDRVEGTAWLATVKHPVTEGLPLDQPVPHSYYDFIALGAGPKGQVVAEGLGKEGRHRAPVVVCGEHGRGRYVACGLALGLATDDAERDPLDAELRLLLNAARWLGSR